MPILFLCPRKAIETLGAFDPRYGFGTCGDDDFNIRLRLAGFSTWCADGAFCHHIGSVAFRKAGLNFDTDQDRGAQVFLAKYGCVDYADVYDLTTIPPEVDLYIPLGAKRTPDNSYEQLIEGRPVDLVLEAMDAEFGAWVVSRLKDKRREERWRVIRALLDEAA